MKISLKYFIAGVFGLSVFSVSCSKKLDVPPPNNLQDQQVKDLLAKGDSAKQVLILGGMANNMPLLFNSSGVPNAGGVSDPSYYSFQGLYVMRSLEGNDMVLGDQPISNTLAGATEYNLGNFQGQNNARENASYWYFGYRLITLANQLLNFLPDDVVGNSKVLQDFKARALVVRAYAYSFLMENYQDAYMLGGQSKLGVPIYTVYDPTQPKKPRASATEVYNFIKSDLNTAISLLQSAGIGFTANQSDIDQGVAKFLLARVSLVTGDYPAVIAHTNDILAEYPSFISEANYGAKNSGTPASPKFASATNAFLNNDINPEVILGFPNGVAFTNFNNLMNVFGNGYGGLNRAYKRIDDRLYSKIAADDYRKDAFQGATPFGNFTYPANGTINTLPSYINFKFASSQSLSGDPLNPDQTTAYYMRKSEVLLMKAEAQAAGSNSTDALSTLNILLAARTRSGALALTTATYPAMTGMTPMEMVQFQTRLEMWGEGGLEFFNNKRWDIPVNRTGSTDHINVTATLSVQGMTMQIPDDEINNNPLAVQN